MLVFGLVSTVHGMQAAGWMITAATVLAGGLLLARTAPAGRARSVPAHEQAAPEPYTPGPDSLRDANGHVIAVDFNPKV